MVLNLFVKPNYSKIMPLDGKVFGFLYQQIVKYLVDKA
jgi:hypothetical protein